jgi:hypothetical protein
MMAGDDYSAARPSGSMETVSRALRGKIALGCARSFHVCGVRRDNYRSCARSSMQFLSFAKAGAIESDVNATVVERIGVAPISLGNE